MYFFIGKFYSVIKCLIKLPIFDWIFLDISLNFVEKYELYLDEADDNTLK